MSKGLGRIQRECLRVIASYESAGRTPTTFNIAAEIYQVVRDRDGNRIINDAQHVATKRALASLRRAGLVASKQDLGLHIGGWIIWSPRRTVLLMVNHAAKDCYRPTSRQRSHRAAGYMTAPAIQQLADMRARKATRLADPNLHPTLRRFTSASHPTPSTK